MLHVLSSLLLLCIIVTDSISKPQVPLRQHLEISHSNNGSSGWPHAEASCTHRQSGADNACSGTDEANDGRNWALLVAGSSGWWNYRHQADVAHAYHVLRRGGVKEEHIILLMYDDLAHSSYNPFPGQLFNAPGGPDVYAGLKIDYRGENITADTFLAVLRGDAASVLAKGSGKVLDTGPNDRIFIFYSDHGAPGMLGMPSKHRLEVLHADQLLQAFWDKHDARAYASIVMYVEACESGSMFEGLLPGNISVYSTTAANAHEDSYATYCPGWEPAPPAMFDTCLGDLYSVSWLENSDQADLTNETLLAQYKLTRDRTLPSSPFGMGSHVMKYGDMHMQCDAVATFLGCLNNGHQNDPSNKNSSEDTQKSGPGDSDSLPVPRARSEIPVFGKQEPRHPPDSGGQRREADVAVETILDKKRQKQLFRGNGTPAYHPKRGFPATPVAADFQALPMGQSMRSAQHPLHVVGMAVKRAVTVAGSTVLTLLSSVYQALQSTPFLTHIHPSSASSWSVAAAGTSRSGSSSSSTAVQMQSQGSSGALPSEKDRMESSHELSGAGTGPTTQKEYLQDVIWLLHMLPEGPARMGGFWKADQAAHSSSTPFTAFAAASTPDGQRREVLRVPQRVADVWHLRTLYSRARWSNANGALVMSSSESSAADVSGQDREGTKQGGPKPAGVLSDSVLNRPLHHPEVQQTNGKAARVLTGSVLSDSAFARDMNRPEAEQLLADPGLALEREVARRVRLHDNMHHLAERLLTHPQVGARLRQELIRWIPEEQLGKPEQPVQHMQSRDNDSEEDNRGGAEAERTSQQKMRDGLGAHEAQEGVDDTTMAAMIQMHQNPSPEQQLVMMLVYDSLGRPAPGTPLVNSFDCLREVMGLFERRYGPLLQYGMRFARFAANLCNLGVDETVLHWAAGCEREENT